MPMTGIFSHNKCTCMPMIAIDNTIISYCNSLDCWLLLNLKWWDKDFDKRLDSWNVQLYLCFNLCILSVFVFHVFIVCLPCLQKMPESYRGTGRFLLYSCLCDVWNDSCTYLKFYVCFYNGDLAWTLGMWLLRHCRRNGH